MVYEQRKASVLSTPIFWIGLCVIAAATGWGIFRRASYGPDHPALYQDDFFYYVGIARNILRLGKPTFDGSTLTNGFHPLWLLVIVLTWWAAGPGHFFTVVDVLIAFMACVTYYLSFSLGKQAGLRDFLALVTSVWVTGTYLILAASGMEIVLTIPLTLTMFHYILSSDFNWTKKQCVLYGTIVSIVILSRIDAVLLIVLIVSLQLLASWAGFRETIQRGCWFLAGTVPFVVYLISNVIWFGQTMPVSGSAKHLKLGLGFSPRPVGMMIGIILQHIYPLSTIMVVAIGIVPVGMIFLIGGRLQDARKPWFVAAFAALLFPCLFLAVVSFESGWPMWEWYYYPFVISAQFGLIAIFRRIQSLEVLRLNRVFLPLTGSAALVYICVLFSAALRPADPRSQSLYPAALTIRRFAASHPGRYAMGDRAGLVSFELGYPLVQLEGLVMDRHYLNLLRAQSPLITVLRAYDVNYYIATNPTRRGACFDFIEPHWSGPTSPKMRDALCTNPLLTFIAPDNTRTYIVDVPRQ